MKATKETKYTLEVNQDELDVIVSSLRFEYVKGKETNTEATTKRIEGLISQMESIQESNND